MVFYVFYEIWFFAGSPINISYSLNATNEGINLYSNSSFIIWTILLLQIPTLELLLPKSIPIAFSEKLDLLYILIKLMFFLVLLILFYELKNKFLT